MGFFVCRIKQKGTELRFVRAQKEHEGVYTCRATNIAGSAVDNGKIVYTGIVKLLLYESTSGSMQKGLSKNPMGNWQIKIRYTNIG